MAKLLLHLDDDFQGVIGAMVKENIDMTEEELADEVDKAADDAVAKLKQRSKKRTGKYAKGWKRSKTETRDGIGSQVVIYNSSKPTLTHLLEKGHAKANGGRVAGDGIINQVYEEVAAQFGEGAK